MAVITCFDVDTDAPHPYIFNGAVVEEADFEYLRSIWPIYCPGRYLAKQEDFERDPDYPPPIWVGWEQRENGLWWNPNYNPDP